MQNLVFTQIPINELVTLISNEVIKNIPQQQHLPKVAPEPEKKYLTRKEVSELFHISFPTLLKHQKKGRLKALRIGNRVLYLECEVLNALKSI